MPERHVCTQIYLYALQQNSVPIIDTTLAAAHRLGENSASNLRESENQDCTVLRTRRQLTIAQPMFV
jgi:hypothetical protein